MLQVTENVFHIKLCIVPFTTGDETNLELLCDIIVKLLTAVIIWYK